MRSLGDLVHEHLLEVLRRADPLAGIEDRPGRQSVLLRIQIISATRALKQVLISLLLIAPCLVYVEIDVFDLAPVVHGAGPDSRLVIHDSVGPLGGLNSIATVHDSHIDHFDVLVG